MSRGACVLSHGGLGLSRSVVDLRERGLLLAWSVGDLSDGCFLLARCDGNLGLLPRVMSDLTDSGFDLTDGRLRVH